MASKQASVNHWPWLLLWKEMGAAGFNAGANGKTGNSSN